MLRTLLANARQPTIVIEECSKDAKESRREQFEYLAAYAPDPSTPTVKNLCDQHGICYVQVDSLNAADTITDLNSASPDYGILGDTRVLIDQVIRTVRHNIINVHPGYLPVVRGNNPYIWALALGLPQGAAAHLVDTGIDTGPILLNQKLDISAIHSFDRLVHEINALCADLLVRAFHGLLSKCLKPVEQPAPTHPTFRKAPKELLDYARTLISKRRRPPC